MAWVGLFAGIQGASGQDWVQTSASDEWFAIASSADGYRLVAASYNLYQSHIYVSTNAGGFWTLTGAPDYGWASVACSANAIHLVAVPQVGPIWTSADGGATWIATGVTNYWTSVASSADGSKLVAAGGQIFTSADFGHTWTKNTAPSYLWTCVASSADGSRLLAASYGPIYVSTNGGAVWTRTSAPEAGWGSVAMSADGTKSIAAGDAGWFTSRDSGNDWTPLVNAPGVFIPGFGGVASSADGVKLAGILATWPKTQEVYLSTNSGATWFPTSLLCYCNSTNYCKVTSSADGCRLAAAIGPYSDSIYTRHEAPQPVLSVTLSMTNLVLSWLIPSQPFVLQETADLVSGNWTDVADAPVLNLTNLQNQVTIPLPGSNRFYRLKGSMN